MRTWWKVLIGLVVALPTLAYVAGTLAATGDEPAPREPIVLEESVAPSASVEPGQHARPDRRDRRPHAVAHPHDDDDDDDDGPETINAESRRPRRRR